MIFSIVLKQNYALILHADIIMLYVNMIMFHGDKISRNSKITLLQICMYGLLSNFR